MKVTTAVFPVAGLGTRFLPLTKAGPKEMLPIVDQPLIQYVVEEAIQAGIKQLIFVTSSNKRSIEDYFDSNFELEAHLVEKNKLEVLKTVQNILPKDVQAIYIRQSHPLGLGDAVLRAKGVVGNQAFAVLLADDIVDCDIKSCIHQMSEVYEQTQASVIGVENIPRSDTDKYGIVSLGDKEIAGATQITAIVEKPKPDLAPSTLGVAGRYILTPRIFDLLENVTKGVGGEIQLTDAIAQLINHESVYAYPFQGRRYDCGTRIGFLEATVAYALKRSDLREPFSAYLKEVCSKL
jgi:UTP--glucose-1-phosphate uridylyltransferase